MNIIWLGLCLFLLIAPVSHASTAGYCATCVVGDAVDGMSEDAVEQTSEEEIYFRDLCANHIVFDLSDSRLSKACSNSYHACVYTWKQITDVVEDTSDWGKLITRNRLYARFELDLQLVHLIVYADPDMVYLNDDLPEQLLKESESIVDEINDQLEIFLYNLKVMEALLYTYLLPICGIDHRSMTKTHAVRMEQLPSLNQLKKRPNDRVTCLKKHVSSVVKLLQQVDKILPLYNQFVHEITDGDAQQPVEIECKATQYKKVYNLVVDMYNFITEVYSYSKSVGKQVDHLLYGK